MKALVTGFDPFGGDTVNPSALAIGKPLQVHFRDAVKRLASLQFFDEFLFVRYYHLLLLRGQ
jgi:hypothetical protein